MSLEVSPCLGSGLPSLEGIITSTFVTTSGYTEGSEKALQSVTCEHSQWRFVESGPEVGDLGFRVKMATVRLPASYLISEPRLLHEARGPLLGRRAAA